jgi:hypothetical protein
MDLEARVAALEGRVRYLEDQEKIRECLAEYGFNADLGRSDNYVAGWTPDGVYDLDSMYLDGEADLRKMIASPDGFHKTQVENRSQHTVLNLYIRIEGDSAWAEGYSVVFVRQDGNIKAILAGYNHWVFERAGSRWLMKRRTRREIGGEVWGGEVIKQYLEEDRLSSSRN